MSPKLLRRAVRELNLFLSGGTATFPEHVFGRHRRWSVDRVGNRGTLDSEPDKVEPEAETRIKVIRCDRKNRRVEQIP